MPTSSEPSQLMSLWEQGVVLESRGPGFEHEQPLVNEWWDIPAEMLPQHWPLGKPVVYFLNQ